MKKGKMKAKKAGANYVWRDNYLYLVPREGPFASKGRCIGKRSPKYPKETEWQLYLRLWFKIPDKAPVIVDASVDSAPEVVEADKPEVKPEVYPGTPKRLPSPGELPLTWAAAGGAPFPLKRDKTWKDLRLWVEKTYEWYRDAGTALSVRALCRLMMAMSEIPYDRAAKLCQRIRAIYAEDSAAEEALWRTSLLVESIQTAGQKQARVSAPLEQHARTDDHLRKGRDGVDKFGFKIGTRCERINKAITNEPKTLREIEKEAGCHGASSHVSRLVRMKVVVKVGKGVFQLAEGQACQESSSEKSESKAKGRKEKSSRKKTGSSSKGSDSGSSRVRSSKTSRKEKRVKSAKRVSRRA